MQNTISLSHAHTHTHIYNINKQNITPAYSYTKDLKQFVLFYDHMYHHNFK